MKKLILITLLMFAWTFGQVKSSQDVLNEALDDDNDAFGSNVTNHYANDGMYNAVTTVDHNINSLNTGESFTYTAFDADIDAADSLFISFVTPNSGVDIHLNFAIRMNLAGRCFLLETPTMTAGAGTDVAVVQMNRGSDVTATVMSSLDSTAAKVTYNGVGDISVLGTTLDSFTFSAVNQEYVSEEWVLDTYKRYVILLISDTAEGIASMKIKLTEHTPDDD